MDEKQRDDLLGLDWQKSGDRAWTTSGDANGFHILVADANIGYTWRTAATLSEPGFDADQWVGNACVTGSGERLVVVYAPRTFTNKADLAARGGFTAVVDLVKGQVTKLPVQTSLAYYNPGCGTGETVALTQEGGEDRAKTRLIKANAVTGELSRPVTLRGQITSAVPTQNGFIAADGSQLIEITATGGKSPFAKTGTVPFHVKSDAEGGVVFMDRDGDKTLARRALPVNGRAASITTLASGELGRFGVVAAPGGRVFVTGTPDKVERLPEVIGRLNGPRDLQVSTEAKVTLSSVAWAGPTDPRVPVQNPASARRVNVKMNVVQTGKQVMLTAVPGGMTGDAAGEGRSSSPALGSATVASGTAATAQGSASNPTEEERTCSVPRNDPLNQVLQPKPRQIEWAIDQAVRGYLNPQRPAGWMNLGMPAYTPQGLFNWTALEGGGFVPAQVMLGVAAQESNLSQASSNVLPGETGNALIGNYYGRNVYNSTPSDDWDVDWSEADCGYGITQVTDGMRLAGREDGGVPAFPYQTQRAVALDFAANIAAGVRILQQKWNETRRAGLTVNNGNAAKIENWFYAVWAYNSGFYPNTGNNSPWGVGWVNNPANPRYPADRAPFLNDTYDDARHPQDWPYPEKVLGWAGHPIELLEAPGTLVSGFRPAWWNGDVVTSALNRAKVKPPSTLFCDTTNACYPGQRNPNDLNEPPGPCSRPDLKCWYNRPVVWKSDCDYSCGNELLRFDPGYAYQADGTSYPPKCDLTGLPTGAMIIDDVPQSVLPVRDCPRSWTNSGTFDLDFASDSAGRFPSKIDFHQVGGGFGSHYWFARTRTADREGGKLRVKGTWTLNSPVNGPAQVLVHLPDHYGYTNQAKYEVQTANGTKPHVITQRRTEPNPLITVPPGPNRWVSLGAFKFSGVPKVTLSTVTEDGTGDETVVFDAVAVVPMTGTFVERRLDAVAVFDPETDLNGGLIWLVNTPLRTMTTLYNWAMGLTAGGPVWNNPDQTQTGVLQLPKCSGSTLNAACAGSNTWNAAKAWHDDVTAAGNSPTQHAPGMTQAIWMNMANPRPNLAVDPNTAFASKHDYKIRTHLDVRYVVGADGKIVSGSEGSNADTTIGDAHMAGFVRTIIDAVQTDYGISKPNVEFNMPDANRFTGLQTHVDPLGTGNVPGQAYIPNTRPAKMDADRSCFEVRALGGGVHGFRPMVGAAGVSENVSTWVDRIHADTRIPTEIKRLTGDIYSMFFKNLGPNNIAGSMIANAPPIWHQISMAFCANGSVKPTHRSSTAYYGVQNAIVFQSYMPDLYVYLDGQVVDNQGNPSNKPAQKGNWYEFSVAGPDDMGQPFNACNFRTVGSNGNPWAIKAPIPLLGDPPSVRPVEGWYCDDMIPDDRYRWWYNRVNSS
ncbi:hypothetical protein ACIBF6_44965 [Streptosporangium amethystogenes]|uniref:golvesin C-terminal-like domain-containing protein n=1 Tax=Streptosporangium amethystogenes TaxID=2002 RepID=UPI0037A859A6